MSNISATAQSQQQAISDVLVFEHGLQIEAHVLQAHVLESLLREGSNCLQKLTGISRID